MLSQTKDAIDRLLKAGLRRADFRIWTPRNNKGEYAARPEIHCYSSVEFTGQQICWLLEFGFDIHITGGDYQYIWITDRPYGKPSRVSLYRAREEDRASGQL